MMIEMVLPDILVTIGTGEAGRSGYSVETAEAYGNAIAVEEALKIGAFTYMAGPGGEMFSGCSAPMGLLGRGATTFALEFVDEAGIKPGLSYLVLNDREAYNNLDIKDILLNCTLASGTVMLVHGVEEFRAYKNAKADVSSVGKTNFENEGFYDGDEAYRLLIEKYGAENVIREKSITATQEMIDGTNIPKSFRMDDVYVNGKEVWVHGNATKHMGEYVKAANGSILVEGELLASFQETVSQIIPNVKPGRNFFVVNGWEIGINGDTGVIYHALYK